MKAGMRDRPGMWSSWGVGGGRLMVLVWGDGGKKSVRSLRFLVSVGMSGAGEVVVCKVQDVALCLEAIGVLVPLMQDNRCTATKGLRLGMFPSRQLSNKLEPLHSIARELAKECCLLGAEYRSRVPQGQSGPQACAREQDPFLLG